MNITTYTDPGLPFGSVTWDMVTATDNSGSVTLTSNFRSGDEFAIGESDVWYTASDQSGNTVTMWFTITVRG